MNNVLKKIHSYVPSCSVNEVKHYHTVGVVGDQLTVERAVNGILSTSNGFTQDERYEGLQVEIADWHAEMNFLNVSVQYYSLQMYNHKPYDMKKTL
jgi:hypothetical protein